MQNNSQSSTMNGSSGQHRYLIGTAGAGGDYVLPEGHDEGSEDEDSEPENHREQEHDEDEDAEDDGYDYEFVGVGNQA